VTAPAPPVIKRRFVAQFILGPTDDSAASLQWQEISSLRDPDHSLFLIFAPVYSNPLRATVFRYVARALRASAEEAVWFHLEGNKWLVDHEALRTRFKLGDEFRWLKGRGFVAPEYDLHPATPGAPNQTVPWVTLRFERDTLQESFETEEQRRTRVFDRMNFHGEIVRTCRGLFVSGHPDHAIFAACKRVNALVQERSGIHDQDGDALFGSVFTSKDPKLKFTPCETSDERNEQDGLRFLFQGMAKAIRNPQGHREVNVDDVVAIEQLGFISLLLRHLDGVKKP
jgi:uncharacterized protein (TIGR02391 family)